MCEVWRSTHASAQGTLPGQHMPLSSVSVSIHKHAHTHTHAHTYTCVRVCVYGYFSAVFTIMCFKSIRSEQKNEI